MLPSLSILSTLFVAFGLFITYLLYSYIIRPYTIIQYYKKQGGIGLFHRKLLRHPENVKNAVEKGDYFYIEREIFRKNPQARFIAENLMSNVVITINDLEMVKEYLRKNEVYQKDGETLAMLFDIAPEFSFFLHGNDWKKKRKIVSSAFNFEFLKHTVPMMVEATQEKFTEWKKNGELKDMRLLDKLGMITGEITGRFFFGKKFGQSSIDGQPVTLALQQIFLRSQREIPTLGVLLFGPKFIKLNLLKRHKELNQLKAKMRNYCEKMIEESEKSQQRENNLLQILLDLRKSDNEEDRLTNKQVVDEFIGLFQAGTDTTSHLVNSAIYFLWKNPAVLKKVKEEVDREFVNLETLTLENLNRMEYTTAFLKESLRLGGPSQTVTMRVAVQDDDLCGVHVKKGTRMVFRKNLYFTSEKFFPNPNEIIPERWLSGEGFNQNALKEEPYAFIPFLAGPRNCIGQHMAMIEARIILGLFVKSFNFSFPEDYQFKMTQKSVFEPIYPLLVTLEPKF